MLALALSLSLSLRPQSLALDLVLSLRPRPQTLPPLPLRTLVTVTKSGRISPGKRPGLSKNLPSPIDLHLGAPSRPARENKHGPKWSWARIPGWSRHGPGQCPCFFRRFCHVFCWFMRCSKAFLAFSQECSRLCLDFVMFSAGCFSKNFLALPLVFRFPDFSQKLVTFC